MNKTFSFKYNCTIKKQGNSIRVVGYNSPYSARQTKQSIDDIEYAIIKEKLIDIKKLPKDKTVKVQFLCKFIENKDGTYNQIFSLIKW